MRWPALTLTARRWLARQLSHAATLTDPDPPAPKPEMAQLVAQLAEQLTHCAGAGPALAAFKPGSGVDYFY